jgi:hypothetical protein
VFLFFIEILFSFLGSFDQSQIIDENQFEIFSNLVRDLYTRINSDIYNKLEWFIQHGLSTSLPSMGVDIGLLSNTCQQIHDIVNKQENSKLFYSNQTNINRRATAPARESWLEGRARRV